MSGHIEKRIQHLESRAKELRESMKLKWNELRECVEETNCNIPSAYEISPCFLFNLQLKELEKEFEETKKEYGHLHASKL